MTLPMGPELADVQEDPEDDALPITQAMLSEDGEALPDDVLGKRRRAVEALYGPNCPLLLDKPDDGDWASWALWLWMSRADYMTPILHRAEKLRMFRHGIQWISAKGNGPWREPPKPKDVVRRVVNMIGPALDWRLQVLSEQRPGVRAKPTTMDPDDVRRATGSNLALEYQYHQQQYSRVQKEAAYWAQTDGVAFTRLYWDDDRGELDHDFGEPLGDIGNRVYRIEQVRVSSNATALEAPLWWCLREELPKAEAVAIYGSRVSDEGVLETNDYIGLSGVAAKRTAFDANIFTGLGNPTGETDVVDRFTVFLKPNPRFLPQGLQLVVVGSLVVSVGPLTAGVVPMVRFADGSSDPAFFPCPQADLWVDDQMALNAVESKMLENIRRNSGGRVIAKAQSLVTDTLRGGNDSIIEVRAPGSLSDVIQPLQGFSVGPDVKETRAALIKRIEDLTGYNDTARGGMSANASGRAILAVREQLERVFAPSIFAAAEAAKEWATITLALIRWGYDVPRVIAALGKERPDLGRELVGDDVDPAIDIELEPETMFPVPRSVRRFELDNMLQMGVIDIAEYRRRLSYADTGNMQTPDAVQEARAMRVCDAIRNGMPVPPMLWQDDEAIHQDVLERELILASGIPDDQLAFAQQRWDELAQQQAMKMGGMPADPTGASAPPAVGEGMALPAQTAPTVAMPGSPLPAEPLLQQQTTQSQAASLFETSAPQ
ncbi:hypothetical protein [Gemmatimonas sp.]|uniref:portal protein n=1 Tax=Gemmatimonas sp. TaxID=1962908 RepID=UPI0025B8B367|nr:hypothetical protein [Gemmatimonas sp.]MCA2992940.1 hypothetical protein [Gemmatimonas sp.]